MNLLTAARWALASSAPLFVMSTPSVAGPADSPAINATSLQGIIDTGMLSWRKRDGDGATCASCHAPDGFDLAYVGFSRSDIFRRASAHVPEEDAVAIANMIEAQRYLYGIPARDPLEFRPMQPGGYVLAGETSAERDAHFGVELMRRMYMIVTHRIDTLEEARDASDELIARNISQLPCGIPFNLWSEDIAHGEPHGLLADWIPDLPHLVRRGHELEWRVLVDTYLSNPSEAHFWAMWDGVGEHVVAPETGGAFDVLVVSKYRAMLIAQHEFRMEAKGEPALASRGAIAFASHPLELEADVSPEEYGPLYPNPAWAIGDFANFYRNNPATYEYLGVPQRVVDGLSEDIPLRQQMAELHLPWVWLGWLHDRGRQRTSRKASVRNGDYVALPFLLHDGGYPIHGAFAIAAKMAAHARHEPSWVVQNIPLRVTTSYGNLMRNDVHIRYEPIDTTSKWVYRRIICNSFRMTMLLFADDVERYGTIYGPSDRHRERFEAMWRFLLHADPENLQANASIYLRALLALE